MIEIELLDAALGDDPLPVSAQDPTTERILDAALAEVTSFGLRRATVDEVARRADVGRMTLHRRFRTKQALIDAMFLREIRRVLAEMNDVIAQHETLTDRLAEGLAFGLRRMHEHPLFGRLLETDRDAMLPYLTLDAGSLLHPSAQFVARQIESARGANATAPRADYAADAIIHFCHSILLTPHALLDLRDETELRAFMRAAISALVGA